MNLKSKEGIEMKKITRLFITIIIIVVFALTSVVFDSFMLKVFEVGITGEGNFCTQIIYKVHYLVWGGIMMHFGSKI